MINPLTLTYRSDPALKARLVAEARAHRDADRYVQETYYMPASPFSGGFVGCSIGCTVMSFVEPADRDAVWRELRAEDRATPAKWHERWSEVTGLPRWLARLNDDVFEDLPPEAAADWPVELFEAIPVGVDLGPLREGLISPAERDLPYSRDLLAALRNAGSGVST